jgi:hypothetical protein
VCCPCLRGQVGKQVEEMWWKDRIVCGRWEDSCRSDFCSVLMFSSRCSILAVSLRVSVVPAILPSSTFVFRNPGNVAVCAIEENLEDLVLWIKNLGDSVLVDKNEQEPHQKNSIQLQNVLELGMFEFSD